MTSMVHYMNRHAYHPIFSFLFFLLTSVYGFSNILNVTEFALMNFGSPDNSLAYELVFLIFLLYKNVRLTQLFRGGKSSLSTRYQLTENIKILRLLVPVVVLDTTVCAADMAGNVFFHVDPYFNKQVCLGSTSYLPAYFVIRLVSLFMEWSIPISIIYQQATPKPVSNCLQVMRLRRYSKTAPKKITNVLGTDIQGSSHQLDYFLQLQQQWSGPLPSKD
ncbi:hypothetical protein ANCCEY_11107 [Ancylostoma ceylanicum]|uniref:Uncharacterized protein n=1 Tax=Ancylostoma ceylanicum TaxID=53326 RepID=A0A0D6LCK4_9BILA|nr:hypothetical protein ANCCEY_11107 [Ancylostoma ceylanicum]